MPMKDTITMGTLRERAVNINFKVGTGGDNGPADVMLVQTMIHYLAFLGNKPMHNVGLQRSELPPISGVCEHKTKQAIFKFQRRNAGKLLAVDGLIEPALYDGRTIRPGEPRVMTMTLFHFLATEMAIFRPEAHYIDGLIKITPQLKPWLS